MGPLTKTFQTTAATTSLLTALLAADGQNNAKAADSTNPGNQRPTNIHQVIKDRTITVVSPKEIQDLVKASGNDAKVAEAALNKLLEERRATEEERQNALRLLLGALALAGFGSLPLYFSLKNARRQLEKIKSEVERLEKSL